MRHNGGVNILVIKLGALGDFVQGFGPYAAIRAAHPGARITLLTTPPFAGLSRAAPGFEEVWEDGRPAWTDLPAVWRLARRLRAGRFDRVYDLQTSPRSSRYRLFVGRRAEWSGVARGASHPHANPDRGRMHTVDNQREQLLIAGITHFPAPELGWLDADLSEFALPERFALLLPGASPTRPGKRWPVERYAVLARALPMPSVVCGGKAEAELGRFLAAEAGALDLTGRTSLFQLAAIARRAVLAVGNDSGPTHVAAAAGCRTLALFGEESEPSRCAPRGPQADFLRHLPLSELGAEEVLAALA
jgi:ADP-heptose:LPS heptosyltransferase